ncbi:beta-galactosidase [Paraglaciecola aquimarina]|uniref:Beta-galactosidase n=1 Tax=Paraglaciecola aquimarina TaxID=1235557 RepID=A0ABU3SZY1_9ALTE|nr:beta-galactosidase [Paraglaciecola aquimarina]MDU0355576.1 beta-galactosidase [Paraglaciecola aquimarina]
MKQLILRVKYLLVTSLLVCSSFACAQSIEEKITTLKALISEAENQKIDAEREKMTIRTAEQFLIWADWDEVNQSTNEAFYAVHPVYKSDPAAHAAALPVFERDSVNTLLSQSIDELTLVIAGDIVRKPAVVADFGKVELSDGQLWQDGKPVFIASYTWKTDEEATNQYFGNLSSQYIAPNHITNEQLDVNQWAIADVKAKKDDKRIGQVFVSHSAIPNWAHENYVDFTVGERLFSKFDIDNPDARLLYSAMFDAFVPELKGQRSTELGYMLFNEPSFFTEEGKWNSGPVSNSTMAKFRVWLADKHGEIASLNNLWDTSFNDFDSVELAIPIASNLKGTAIWFDWARFNQSRVVDWFVFLNDEIDKHDSEAKTHIKLMPWLWNENARDHGMDFEALLELGDIIGFDAESSYTHAWKTPEYLTDYSFDWQSPMMSFDFFSSVQLGQLLWDSENHFLMNGGFQLKDINPNYVSAVYWLAATHGLSGTSTWVWGRDADGSTLKRGGYGSSHIVAASQQPLVLHAVTRTFMDLSAHGEDIVLLQNQPKPIRIFYSESSAIAQQDYMTSIRDSYKHLYFDGMALGFVTQNILNKKADDWGIVVISQTEYVTDAEFAAIQAYVDRGGVVFKDAKSLQYNEYGMARAVELTAGKGLVVEYTDETDLHNQLMDKAKEDNLLPKFNVEQLNHTGTKTVAWRSAKREDGSVVTSLVNAGKELSTVTLSSRDEGFELVADNLLLGQTSNLTFVLAPMETRFLALTFTASETSEVPWHTFNSDPTT